MRNWITKLQPNPWHLRKLIILAIVVAVGVGAFFYGRRQATTGAVDPNIDPRNEGGASDYSRRVVARLYNEQVPVTREELGEYLIARFGSDRLEFMINRKIVEMECRKFNIVVTDAEVEARFQQDLRSFGTQVTEKEFVTSILRRFGKTLFEWKEDVIRPKIMMEKYVQATVKISDADVQEGFDARYGPKVECRMIVCDKGNRAVAQKVWESASKGRAFFLDEAKKQFIPNLASAEGKVPPIHKNFGDKDLEEGAFRLKVGEVSGLMEMKDGTYVILLCEQHLPANSLVRIEDKRQELSREMFELRVAQKIPDAFNEMRKRATPKLLLDNTGFPTANVMPAPEPLPNIQPQANVKPVEIPPAPVPQPIVPVSRIVPPEEAPALKVVPIPMPAPMPPPTPAPTTLTAPPALTPPPVVAPVIPKKN